MTFPVLSSLDTKTEWVSFAKAKGAFKPKHVSQGVIFAGSSTKNLVMLVTPLTPPVSSAVPFQREYCSVALVSYWAAKVLAFRESIPPRWER